MFYLSLLMIGLILYSTNKWANSFLNSDMLKDYNAYLWGSFPEKRTQDVDVLLSKGPGVALDPAEMEELSMANLEESLVKNNFLIDLGFTDRKFSPFSESWNNYQNTGKTTPNNGKIFGETWYVDGNLWKDRTKGLKTTDGGRTYPKLLGNNMLDINGEIPYPKMTKRSKNNSLPNYYNNKPMMIKQAGRGY